MDSVSTTMTRQLPLHQKHTAFGAKLGVFGDWEVPLYYTSILDEHQTVRTGCGLFDISHMGEFDFSGPQAQGFLNRLLPRNIPQMPEGRAWYMPLLNDAGGIVDDIILYKYSMDHFLMIVNAGNIQKDFDWISQWVPEQGVKFENQSEAFGLLALQGPKSVEVIDRVYPDLRPSQALRYYHFLTFSGGVIARTGYTGEDGFEIMVKKEALPALWDKLFDAGKDSGLKAVGFGARDTLRLEAAMPLYGHDLMDEISPLEAGIDWAVDFEKDIFIGQKVLQERKQRGIRQRLIGFEMKERGIPRQGYPVSKDGQVLGIVTSGSFSPTLQKNIGLAYVQLPAWESGTSIEIIIRDKPVKAQVVALPFYRRKKS